MRLPTVYGDFHLDTEYGALGDGMQDAERRRQWQGASGLMGG